MPRNGVQKHKNKPVVRPVKTKRIAEKQKIEHVDRLAMEYVSGLFFIRTLLLMKIGVGSARRLETLRRPTYIRVYKTRQVEVALKEHYDV